MRDITVSGKGEREALPLIDAGLQVAKLYCIADVGKHYDERYGKVKEELIFIWELPDFRIEIEKDGEKKDLPRAISRTYTKSLGEKANLRKDLESWRGKSFTEDELEAFSLKAVLGKTCQLNIIHATSKNNGKTYANISAVLSAPRGCKHEPPENPCIMWGIGDSTELVPKWVAEKAASSIDADGCIDRSYEQGELGFGEKVERARAMLKGETATQSKLALLSSTEAQGILVAAYEEVGEDAPALIVAIDRAISAKEDQEETRSDLDDLDSMPF